MAAVIVSPFPVPVGTGVIIDEYLLNNATLGDDLINNIINNFDFWCCIEETMQIQRMKYVICLLDTLHDHYITAPLSGKDIWKYWLAYYIHKRHIEFPSITAGTPYNTTFLCKFSYLTEWPSDAHVAFLTTSEIITDTEYESINRLLFNGISEIPWNYTAISQAPPVDILNDNHWIDICCREATLIGFALLTRWIKRRDTEYGGNVAYCNNSFTSPNGLILATPPIPPHNNHANMVFVKKNVQTQLSSFITDPIGLDSYIYDQGAPSFTSPIIGTNNPPGNPPWELVIGVGGKYDKSGKNTPTSTSIYGAGVVPQFVLRRADYEGILGFSTFTLDLTEWRGIISTTTPAGPLDIPVTAPIQHTQRSEIKSLVSRFITTITPGVTAIIKSTGKLYTFFNKITGGPTILNVLNHSATCFDELFNKGLSPTTDIKRLGDWSQSYEIGIYTTAGNRKYIFATGDYLAAGIACYFNDVTTLLTQPKLPSAGASAGYLIMYNSEMVRKTTPLQCIADPGDLIWDNYNEFKDARLAGQVGGVGGKINFDEYYKNLTKSEMSDIVRENRRRITNMILNPSIMDREKTNRFSIQNSNADDIKQLNINILLKLLLTIALRFYHKLTICKEKGFIDTSWPPVLDDVTSLKYKAAIEFDKYVSYKGAGHFLDDSTITYLLSSIFRSYYGNENYGSDYINSMLSPEILNELYDFTDADDYAELGKFINFNEYFNYYTIINSYHISLQQLPSQIVDKDLYNGFYNLNSLNILELFVESIIDDVIDVLKSSDDVTREYHSIVIILLYDLYSDDKKRIRSYSDDSYILEDLGQQAPVQNLSRRIVKAQRVLGGGRKNLRNIIDKGMGEKSLNNISKMSKKQPQDKPAKPKTPKQIEKPPKTPKQIEKPPKTPKQIEKPPKTPKQIEKTHKPSKTPPKKTPQEKPAKPKSLILEKNYIINELKNIARQNNIKITKKVDYKYITLNKRELITTLKINNLI